jgi:hypothetical protein
MFHSPTLALLHVLFPCVLLPPLLSYNLQNTWYWCSSQLPVLVKNIGLIIFHECDHWIFSLFHFPCSFLTILVSQLSAQFICMQTQTRLFSFPFFCIWQAFWPQVIVFLCCIVCTGPMRMQDICSEHLLMRHSHTLGIIYGKCNFITLTESAGRVLEPATNYLSSPV